MLDPLSSATEGYHLFFEPFGSLADEASSLIQRLASQNDGPIFTPHITLLARIPTEKVNVLIEKTSTFAQTLSPFLLTLAKLDAEDAYFRAVYITMREQAEMKSLHIAASKLFSMEPDPSYKAHLSLLYGNYSSQLKQALINELDLPQTHAVMVDSISLYRTKGEASEWERIQKFSFQ